MKSRGESAPARIVVKDEHWLVPVIRGLSFESEKEAEAYLLADNQLTIAAGFDEKLLAEILPEHAVNVAGLGFSQEELEKYIPRFRTVEMEAEIPQVVEQAVSRTGDLWVLGEHRVLCGDSTKPEDLNKLMGENKPSMVFADPPYGMNLDTDFSSMKNPAPFKGVHGGKKHLPVIGDTEIFDPSFLLTTFADCPEIFLWGADYYAEKIPNRNNGSWFVWDKQVTLSDEIYGSNFELCWSKAKHKRLLIRVMWKAIFGMSTKDEHTRLHPTQKPVELATHFIQAHSKETVFDPFLGSGTTLIAAEQLGRTCYGCEIEPRYVDVCCKRWMKLTGKDARLGPDGPTFKQVEAERLKAQTMP